MFYTRGEGIAWNARPLLSERGFGGSEDLASPDSLNMIYKKYPSPSFGRGGP